MTDNFSTLEDQDKPTPAAEEQTAANNNGAAMGSYLISGSYAVIRDGSITSSQSVKCRLALVFALCAVSALAQMPNPYGPPISLDNAKKAAAPALAEARKNNWTVAVAIVDTSGHLVYYERMDNTQIASADIAIDKARSADLYKRPTRALQDMLAGGGSGLRVLGLKGAVPVEGGIPLITDAKIVGAIGVSGDTNDHDGQCAKAGADALK